MSLDAASKPGNGTGAERLGSMPIVPAAISIGELCLVPLLFLVLAFHTAIADALTNSGLSADLTLNVSFLRRQREFLVDQGLDSVSLAKMFQVFALMVWLSIGIASLRLVSAPFIFGYWNRWYISRQRRYLPATPEGVIAGFILIGPLTLWISTWPTMASSPVLRMILHHAPQAYLSLEAFVFVGSLIFTVEAVVLFALWMVKRWTPLLQNPYELSSNAA
jgi:hypothetical protein